MMQNLIAIRVGFQKIKGITLVDQGKKKNDLVPDFECHVFVTKKIMTRSYEAVKIYIHLYSNQV
ncbi:hypothetical protein C5167_025667 [Papaver somniferum]|uniref:Uncharacterized protein n=1 Tax=Papaver somniferum TaxID=3469 RepID=A0A4Y7JW31_PAPSO|nr:hypothetical protein C5167_025667 [Papaver somniferum]